MTGIRAELVFERVGNCPVAAVSRETAGPVTDITWTGSDEDAVTEQVTLAGDQPPDGDRETAGAENRDECAAVDGTLAVPASGVDGGGETSDLEQVFDYGSRQVYEFERDLSGPCVCEYIEQSVGPVAAVYADDGDLHVTVHTRDVDAVRDLVSELNERFGAVRLAYLVRSRVDDDDADLVPVDLERLTTRQREVLERAHEMGYFEYPREANASEVADALGIGASTFIEHLNTAQSKLLADLLERS